MQVLTLTTIYPHSGNVTEGRSVAMLDRALAQQGICGTTLVLKPWIPRTLARQKARWQHVAVRSHTQSTQNLRVIFGHYLHVPVRYNLKWNVIAMAWRARQLIQKHKIDFELAHGQSIYPAALAAHRVAEQTRVPFVITLRDDLSHLQHWYETRNARTLFEPMFARVSAVFAHGPAIVRDAPRFIPSGAHPTVLLAPNGVDIQGIEKIIAAFAPSPSRTVLHMVSVSSLFRYKGIHENLQALHLLTKRGITNWHYTVVGDGPYRAELEQMAREYGIAERVEFRGRLAHADALRAMCEADFFCLPSWSEPFGNVYAEAAVCGRAAIGCRGYGAEIMIRDGETGILVEPRDVDDLANKLEFLFTHPDETKRMGARAQQQIRQFTWERTAELYKANFVRIVEAADTYDSLSCRPT